MNTSSYGAIFENTHDATGARELARSVRSFLEQLDLDPKSVNDWELLTAEAANRAVLGQKSPSSQPDRIEALVNVWPDSVVVSVESCQAIVSSEAAPAAPLDDEEEMRRHLGDLIITQLTDATRDQSSRQVRRQVMWRSLRSLPESDAQCNEVLESTLDLMTEELGASYESLCALFQFSQEFAEAEDASACIQRWLKEVLRLTGATWFVFRRVSSSANSIELIATSLDDTASSEPVPALLLDTDSIEATVFNTGKEMWFDGCTPSVQRSALQDLLGHDAAGLSCPVKAAGKVYGVLSVGFEGGQCPFSARDSRIVRAFAGFTGIQLGFAEARRESLLASLMRRDLASAAEAQRSLLPKIMPVTPGYSSAALLIPALQVGGDLYDVISVDDEGTLFVIADVMGKGSAAALFAILLRSHLHALTRHASQPGELLSRLNAGLFADLDNCSTFISVQVAWLDHKSGSITIATAGHCPALAVDPQGHVLIEARGDGPPLGISRDATFAELRLTAEQAGHVLMITDGATDARNPKGEMLGKEPLITCLTRFAANGGVASGLLDNVRGVIHQHVAGADAADDITLLVISRQPLLNATPEPANPSTYYE